MKKNNFFWIGYSDLLTSLFFVMLVLFVITFLIFKKKNSELQARNQKLELIEEVETALGSLDSTYFAYDSINKRYKLSVDVNFRPNSSRFSDLSNEEKAYLKNAGQNLFSKISSLIKENPAVEYLLIIEGNTQRAQINGNWNHVTIPNIGYKKSYERALALVNFWKVDCEIPFDEISKNCELLIAGSGYFGQSREQDERLNRRFTIQVTSKVGKLLDQTAQEM